jgi:hypothetical protein
VNADIWIVLIEDRHAEPDVLAFSSEERAVGYSRARTGHDGVPAEELTDRMREDGWVLVIPYGTEGDRFRVVRRTLDAP